MRGVLNNLEELDLEELEGDDNYVYSDSTMPGFSDWHKESEDCQVWWVERLDFTFGEYLFSFDKKKLYDLFADYPHNMTAEEVEIFDKENPYWANFFSWRKKR